MAETTDDIILNIEVKYEDGIKEIARLKQSILELQNEQKNLQNTQKNLDTSTEQGAQMYKEYNKSISAAKVAIDQQKQSVLALEKEIKNNIKIEKEQEGSINSMRASLSNLKSEYAALSAADRENIKIGGEKLTQMSELNEELKVLEKAYGDHQREVGNYALAGKELKKELKNLKLEMIALTAEGKHNSEEYRNIQAEAQKLEGILKRKNQTVAQITNTMTGLTGAYGMYKVAAVAAGYETEKLDKTMAKLTIVLTALSSWEAINKMLTSSTIGMKSYDAATKAATVVQKLFTTSVNTTSSSFKLLRGAIIATGIGALIVAVGYLVSNLDKLTVLFSKSAKAAKDAEVANAAYERQVQKTATAISYYTNKRQLEMDELSNKSRKQILQMQIDGATEEQINKKKLENEKAIRAIQDELSNDIIENKNDEIDKLRESIIEKEKEKKTYKEGSKEYKKAAEELEKLTQNMLALDAAVLKEQQSIKNNAITNEEAAQKMADDSKKAEKEKSDSAKKAAQDRAKTAQEIKQKELEAIRQLEDSALSLIKDNQTKEIEQNNLSFSRQIEDLKKRLTTEKNLTKTAKETINKTITNLQIQQNNQLAEINKKYSEEELNRQIELETKRIDLMLSAAKKGSEDYFNLQKEKLQNSEDEEIRALEKSIKANEAFYAKLAELAENEAGVNHGNIGADADVTAEILMQEEIERQKTLITKKYQTERENIDKESTAKILADQKQAIENDFNEKLLKLGEDEAAKLQLKLDTEIAYQQQLVEMDAATKEALFDSNSAYEAAVIESRGRIVDAEKAVQAASAQTLQNQLSATSGFADAISGIMTSLGEDNEKYAGFQKALALFNIAINTATAISGAISAATPGDPYTVAIRIAAAIAAAIAGTAAALSSAKGAKQPKAPKFAQGGTVEGAGSGTSDSITAQLSSGESVMTALATQMFAPIFSSLNQIGGGVPIQAVQSSQQVMGEDMLARAMAKGMSSMPNPIVSVQEINNVNNRVTVLENMRTL